MTLTRTRDTKCRPLVTIAASLGLAIALAGCGGGSSDEADGSDDSSTETTTEHAAASDGGGDGSDDTASDDGGADDESQGDDRNTVPTGTFYGVSLDPTLETVAKIDVKADSVTVKQWECVDPDLEPNTSTEPDVTKYTRTGDDGLTLEVVEYYQQGKKAKPDDEYPPEMEPWGSEDQREGVEITPFDSRFQDGFLPLSDSNLAKDVKKFEGTCSVKTS